MKRKKYSEDTAIKIQQLADDLAQNSFVTTALSKYLHQILEFVFDEYIQPYRGMIEKLEEREKLLEVRAELAEEQLSDLKEVLHRIQSWCDAYPLDIFPEPNLKRIHEILQEHGMTLDAISASSMRHVLKGISKIIKEGEP